MKNKTLLGLIIILLSGFISVSGQNDCSCKKMIEKIDSISVVKNIKYCYLNKATGHDKKIKFVFDGPFLVLDNEYYNIEKLLSFIVREDYIEFYFQPY
jgi:hypothetical protein